MEVSPFLLMSMDRSRATTVSGVFDRVGSALPAASTISRTDIGTLVSRRILSTTASVLIVLSFPVLTAGAGRKRPVDHLGSAAES